MTLVISQCHVPACMGVCQLLMRRNSSQMARSTRRGVELPLLFLPGIHFAKVKNCSSYNNLPILAKCDILKQYCRFLEIVEQNYSKHFIKRSLRRHFYRCLSESYRKCHWTLRKRCFCRNNCKIP